MKKLKALLWIPVPLLLFWAIKDIQFTELFSHLGKLTPLQIAALLAVNITFVLILTLRWAVILRGLGAPTAIARLLSYRLAGYAVSYLTPGEDIVEYAKTNNIEEIILGVVRKSKVGKLIFGSTAQFVILNAVCPVTTLK